jgi:Berberine and berberine like
MQGSEASEANLQAGLAPFLTALSKFEGIKAGTPRYSNFKSYKAWFDYEFGMAGDMNMKRTVKRDPVNGVAEPNGLTQMDSRLLGERHFKSTNLASAIKAAMPNVTLGQLRGHLVIGPGVAAQSSTSETSVNPAWRSAITHLIATGIPGDWNVDSLRALSADSGAYANEASWNQTNWKNAFWGDNYSKLSSIKTKYDPKNVLWASPGINADLLALKDGRLCSTAAPSNIMEMNLADRGSMPPANDNTNVNTDASNDEGTTILSMLPPDDIVANVIPQAGDSS